MRAASLAPRTWLLAGIAGWAVCLWIFSLIGLGGRIGDAREDAAPQPLPSTKIPNAERPGSQAQYVEIASRPLFSENRRPQPFRIPGAGEDVQVNTFDYTLTSVLMAGDVRLAILKPAAEGAQPVRVKLGEAVETAPQWTLSTLQPRQAVFVGPEGEKVLDLRVFNGVGAAAPPPMASAAPQNPAPGAVINETPPGQPGNENPPAPAPPQIAELPSPTPPPQQQTDAAAPVSTEAQLEAIRRRIEARRAQIRQQSAQEGQNPGGAP